MEFLKKIPVYCFQNSRVEFHSALTVLLYASIYWIFYNAIDLFIRIFDWRFIIDYEFAGYLVGCIGSGEIVRGLTKLYLIQSGKYRNIFGTVNAGATLGGVFGYLMLLKWHHEPISVIYAALGGIAFYLLLHWLLYLEAKKQKNT